MLHILDTNLPPAAAGVLHSLQMDTAQVIMLESCCDTTGSSAFAKYDSSKT